MAENLSLLKTCTKCKTEQLVDNFGKSRGYLQSWCKTCTNEAVRKRNKERYQEERAAVVIAQAKRKLLE